jgi:hypothetical protein
MVAPIFTTNFVEMAHFRYQAAIQPFRGRKSLLGQSTKEGQRGFFRTNLYGTHDLRHV